MMENKATRILINAADIVQLTGRSAYTARRWLKEIRKKHHKAKNAMVTIEEFCDHTGIDEGKVRKLIE